MQNLKITMVQSGLHWEDIGANLQMFSKKLDDLAGDTDLIILPEMFNTGFSMNSEKLAEAMNGRSMEWMKGMAALKNCVIAGSLIITENNKYYNRMIWMRPDGSYETYNKRHLFRMAGEHHHFSPGHKKLIVELKGWRVCPMVCYDLRFPVWSRNTYSTHLELDTIEPSYDLLIYNANWPEPRSNAWKILLKARAIENQVYVAGVNRVGKDGNDVPFSGDSAIIDPRGKSISTTPSHEEAIETVSISYDELETFRRKFPVGMDADEFTIKG